MALPTLPSLGQTPWYVPRTNWDNAVELELETRLSSSGLDSTFVRTVSPLEYGAVGDNTADDTVALQASLSAAATLGLNLDLRGLTYRTTDQLNVPALSTIRNGTIRCTGTGKRILNVTGNNVRISQVNIVGRHSVATASANEVGIYVDGASAASPISGIFLDRVSVSKVGMYGILLKFTSGFNISGCSLRDLGYAGIATFSSTGGRIEDNEVVNILAGFSSNGYGITLTRTQSDSLVTEPRSSNISITNNHIEGVPWEGIDTHGGENLIVSGNTVFNCTVGIAMVGSDDLSNTTIWGPLNIEISGNLIDSRVTDGSLGVGISIAGAPGGTTATSTEAATGRVVGNIIRGHGNESSTNSGAMRFRDTSAMVISDNVIIEPSPHGIVLLNTNLGVVTVNNTIVDHWSNTVSVAAAIHLPSGYNTGNISNNLHRDNGGKPSATYRNARGYNCPTVTGVDIQGSGNVFTQTTLPTSGTTATKNRPEFQTQFGGLPSAPGLAFGTDTASGFYPIAASDIGFAVAGARKLRFQSTAMFLEDGYNIALGTTNGTRLGTATTHKLGLWGATPVTRPAAIANATDAASAITQLNLLLATARSVGLIAP